MNTPFAGDLRHKQCEVTYIRTDIHRMNRNDLLARYLLSADS